MPTHFMIKYKGLTQSVNPRFTAKNIYTTAQEIIDLEAATKRRYEFGAWSPTLKLDSSQWGGQDAKDAWQKSVNDVPAPIRKAMTELVRGNLLSGAPMPMVFDVAMGADHGIVVGYGEDASATPPVPAILITMICPR